MSFLGCLLVNCLDFDFGGFNGLYNIGDKSLTFVLGPGGAEVSPGFLHLPGSLCSLPPLARVPALPARPGRPEACGVQELGCRAAA